MIRSMLFTCEVSNKALEQMTAPIITVVRGPNRLDVLATNVLKIPRPTIASDPTSAEEKKNKTSVWCNLSQVIKGSKRLRREGEGE